MSEKHWIDDEHYRVVSDDGTKSWVYKADGGMFLQDTCTEVADHDGDQTTAYEYDGGFFAGLFHGGRGKVK